LIELIKSWTEAVLCMYACKMASIKFTWQFL